MENAPCMRTFQKRSVLGGLRNPQTSAQLLGIDRGPYNGVGPCGVGNAVCKGFVDSTDVAASPRCAMEITCNHVSLTTNHDSTDGEDELLVEASLFGVDVASM